MTDHIHNNIESYPVIGFLPVQNQVYFYAPDEQTLVCHCTSKMPGTPKGTKRDPIKITYHFGGSTVRVIPNNHEHNCLIGQACTLSTRGQMETERIAEPDAREFEYSVDSDSKFFWSETAERVPVKNPNDMDTDELQAFIDATRMAQDRKLAKLVAIQATL